MSDVDASQPGGSVSASQPGGDVAASQVGGTVGARLAQPQANLWTPAQIGSDLALWLDVWDSDFDLRTDGATDYVERWGDLSGNGNDATQATGSEQPILRSDDVRFESDYMTAPTPFLNGQSEYAVFVLSRNRNTPNNFDDRFLSRDTKGSQGAYIFRRDEEHFFNTSGSYQSDIGSPLRDLFTIRFEASTLEYHGNGVLQDSYSTDDSTISSDQQPFVIGGAADGSQKITSAEYQIVLEVQGLITSAQIRKIEGWAAWKAGRNGIPEPLQNLPSDHPYADNPPTV